MSKLTKHIQFRFLYIQDLVKNSVLRIVKVHTSVNPADVMTKHLTQHVLKKHLENLGLWCEDGFDFGTNEASVVNSTMHDSSKIFTIGMIAISSNSEDYVTRTTITHSSFGSNYISQQATRQGLSLTDLRLSAKGLSWCDMTGLPPLIESDTQDDYPMTPEEQARYDERASNFPSHIGDVMPQERVGAGERVERDRGVQVMLGVVVHVPHHEGDQGRGERRARVGQAVGVDRACRVLVHLRAVVSSR